MKNMIPDKPSIAIVGAGAVGGYYGARLAQHGHDVHFLLRSDYDAVRRGGLVVESCDGDFRIPADAVRAYDDPRRMPAVDLVIVTLKSTSNDRLDPLVRPLLKDGTAVLTLQNGLGNEDRLAELFGAPRVLGGMAFVCINRVAPGVVRHTDHGIIRLGEFSARERTARADRVAAMFNASRVKCEVLDDLRFGRWQKLVWNVPFNGLGATLDLTTDRLVGTGEGLALVRQLMEEVRTAARADGVELPADLVDVNINNTVSMGPYKSSMQVDRQQGRPMEVEAILGEPLRRAGAGGAETPVLEALYRAARVVDAGIRIRAAAALDPA
jgi:2-dehydropantoate 2-reductase